jgi:uncharacterized protein (TIGR02284 family)
MSNRPTGVSANQEEVVTTLNDLARVCFDSAEGFARASDHVNSDAVKVFFSGAAVQREKFVRELLAAAAQYGNVPAAAPTVAGTDVGYRGWMRIKAVLLTGVSENALLAACLTEEQSTETAYREALDKPLPQDVSTMVQRQFEGVVDVRRNLEQFKEIAEKQQQLRELES